MSARKRRVRLTVARSYESTPESRAIVAEVERRVAEAMAHHDRFIWRRSGPVAKETLR